MGCGAAIASEHYLYITTASRACDRRLTPWRIAHHTSVPNSSPLALCTMRCQPPRPLMRRQVSSHAASSGCALPGSRSPRSPVREGQRQRRPAHTSAVSSPTAQSGIVFAPSASRRQRSPGKTPCVAGGEKQRAPSSQRGIRMGPNPSVTQHQAPQRPRALGGR